MFVRAGLSRSAGVVVGVALVVEDANQLIQLTAEVQSGKVEDGFVLITTDSAMAERLLPFNNAIQAIVAEYSSDDVTVGHPSVPIVSQVGDATASVQNGDVVIVEGYRGLVVVNPSLELISKFQKTMRYRSGGRYRLEDGTDVVQSLDGQTVRIFSHLNADCDISISSDAGADGAFLDGAWVTDRLTNVKWVEQLIDYLGGRAVAIKMPSSINADALKGILRLSEELTVTAVYGDHSITIDNYRSMEAVMSDKNELADGISLSRPLLTGMCWQPGDELVDDFGEANSLWVELPPVGMLDKQCAGLCYQQNRIARLNLLTRMGVTGYIDPSVFGIYLGLGYSDLCLPDACIIPCKKILPMISISLAREAVAGVLSSDGDVAWSDILDQYRINTQ